MFSAKKVTQEFLSVVPSSVDYAVIRVHDDSSEEIVLNRGHVHPRPYWLSQGAYIEVRQGRGMAYVCIADLSKFSLEKAVLSAQNLAQANAENFLFDYALQDKMTAQGEYSSPVKQNWSEWTLKQKIDHLKKLDDILSKDSNVVNRSLFMWRKTSDRLMVSTEGAEIRQSFDRILPEMSVTLKKGSVVATRGFGRYGNTRQGGLEIIEEIGFNEQAAQRILDEANKLVVAETCPSKTCDVLIDPNQMMLQIHESIGHPLELDRILGDERNYAGTSFVTPEMFGSFQYGSDLLNVTFDPTISGQTASYEFDDDGQRAQKEYLIKDGVLQRGLGAQLSQKRSGLKGVANSRSVSWNRPTMDRMSNINLEAGSSSMQDMVSQVEDGIFVKTNTSWSIDDSRNKFQFGCEWAEEIKNGQLTGKVFRDSGYRGISQDFWRNLKAVGNQSTVEVLGTPTCGKGEPNQAIFVGHSTPTCLFSDIEVFGGKA